MDILLSSLQIHDFPLFRDLVEWQPTLYGWLIFKNLVSASNSLLVTPDKQVHTNWYTNYCVPQQLWLKANGGARQERWVGQTQPFWFLGCVQVRLVFPSCSHPVPGIWAASKLCCEPHCCYLFPPLSCLTPSSIRGYVFSLSNWARSFTLASKARKSMVQDKLNWSQYHLTLLCCGSTFSIKAHITTGLPV